MTNQEAFDKVWAHFVVGKAPPSIDEHGSCLYRGPGGARCAYGLLIPDDKYVSGLDVCGSVTMVKQEYPEVFESVGIPETFAYRLQRAHDAAAAHAEVFHREVEDCLRVVAEDFALSIPSAAA